LAKFKFEATMLRKSHNLVNASDIYKLANCPKDKSVANWLSFSSTRAMVQVVAETLGKQPKDLYEIPVGKIGKKGTIWLHGFLAIKYSEYLGYFIYQQVKQYLNLCSILTDVQLKELEKSLEEEHKLSEAYKQECKTAMDRLCQNVVLEKLENNSFSKN
jgi:KilA-N domain